LSFYKDKLDQSILDVLERKPDFYTSYNEIKKYMESNLLTTERKIDFQRKINSILINTKENIKKVIDQYNEFSNKQRLILHIFLVMFLVSI
jgi:CII-binding regulator of phage lambda lysogenization HflD